MHQAAVVLGDLLEIFNYLVLCLLGERGGEAVKWGVDDNENPEMGRYV